MFIDDRKYTLIASFTHGNAIGVVLEPVDKPVTVVDLAPEETWEVRIGMVDRTVGGEFPREDYERVVADLKEFLLSKDVPEWVTIPAR